MKQITVAVETPEIAKQKTIYEKAITEIFKAQRWVVIEWDKVADFQNKYRGKVKAITKHYGESIVYLVTDDTALTMILLEYPDCLLDVVKDLRGPFSVKKRQYLW